MGDGDDGGMGDDGLGMGGFGDGLSDGGGFAGPAPGNMGDAPSMSDAGLGFGFADAGFGDNALSSFTDITDLSQALSDFGLDAMDSFSMPDLSFSMPDTSNSFMTTLQDLSKSKLGKIAMNLLGVPLPAQAAVSSNPAGTIGKGAIGMMASTLGPIGALGFMGLNALGAFDSFTNALGNTNAPASFQGNDANMGIGDALPGLAGMYAGYQGMRDSSKMLGGLQSLYGQDSPYAQALRQQLQRKDAAGGRRSQYGPREVELQAKLAQMASGQIGAMSQLQQRQNINRAQMLQQGLGAFNKLGGMGALERLLGIAGRGGLYDTGATQALGNLGNIFGTQGMDTFGALLPDLGFNFDMPSFGG